MDGAEEGVADEGSEDMSEVGHHQNFVDDEGQSTCADEAMAEGASTRGKPVEQFLEDDFHRLRGRQHLDYLCGPTRSRRSRSCSPPRSRRSEADFQSGEGYGAVIPATFVEIKRNCDAGCHRWALKGLRSRWMEWTTV